jgi:ABC-type nitrate/sulfonate/bicarbonate transport system permease component
VSARGRRRVREALLSWSGVSVLVLAWALGTHLGWIDPFVLPPPRVLAQGLWTFVTRGHEHHSFAAHVLASLFRTSTGFTIGLVCGVPVGLLMGYFPTVNAVLSPLFAFIRPIPVIAFIPLVILYFGIGELSKVMLISATSFWYIVLNTANGVRSVPHHLIQAAENLGLNRRQMFASVILPGSMPFVMVGVKTTVALSWAVVVAAELIAAQQGLGHVIMDAGTFFNIPLVYVGIGLIGLIGLVLERIVTAVERRVLHWQGR